MFEGNDGDVETPSVSTSNPAVQGYNEAIERADFSEAENAKLRLRVLELENQLHSGKN